MTGLERIRRALEFEKTHRVPVAPLLGAAAVAQAGVPHQRACRNAEVQAGALLQAVERYRPDGIFTLMDLSAEPEALGAGVEMKADQPPVISRVLSPDQLGGAALVQRILTGRVPAFVQTVRRLRAALGDSVLVGALLCGPLTALSNAIGVADLSRMLRRDCDTISDLLERLARACSTLVAAHADAGAHAVVVLEPLATSAILGPPDLEALVLAHLRTVTTAARRAGALSILHVCGDCRRSLRLLADAGADALSLDSAVDLPAARVVTGRRVALMGNLDVRRLLPHGTPEAVESAARELVASMGEEGGFVLSTGCELPAQTPPWSIAALMNAARCRPSQPPPAAHR